MLLSLKFKITFAVAILAMLAFFSFVGNSDAREILDLGPHNGDSNIVWGFGYGASHRSTVNTDEPFYCVWWYIDDVLAGWSDGSNIKTQASITFDGFFGSVAGTEYVIKAEVGWLDDNGDAEIVSESYTITVYEPFHILVMRPEAWCYNPVGTDMYEDYDVFESLTHEAYVSTSDPYQRVDWYASKVGEDRSEPTHTTMGDGVSTYASFNPSSLSGSLGGTDYTIKAVAWYTDDDGFSYSFTQTYQLTVYEPYYTYDVDKLDVNGKPDPDIPEVQGYSEITRYYRSGDDMILNYYVSASYTEDADKSFTGVVEIKNTIHGLDEDTYDYTDISALDKDNRFFSGPFNSDDDFTLTASFSSGTTGWEYDCEAYVRLTIKRNFADDEDDYYLNRRFTIEK
ncbi:hypothetical protein F4X73_12815 [Candidatus Poribacteria bacterium]|nr:hypothetical protein [Candidatus Poribacteria bacterium]MYB65565.1 hypothetical protein [Candidatus Poribacteria bacterium]MYF56422.1 hypothetical protein [Candidatus Poribacteria bacterium]